MAASTASTAIAAAICWRTLLVWRLDVEWVQLVFGEALLERVHLRLTCAAALQHTITCIAVRQAHCEEARGSGGE